MSAMQRGEVMTREMGALNGVVKSVSESSKAIEGVCVYVLNESAVHIKHSHTPLSPNASQLYLLYLCAPTTFNYILLY